MERDELLKLIQSRRVVRHFDRDREIPADALQRITRAALWAPLSIYQPQGWKFIVLSGNERERIGNMVREDHTVLKFVRFMFEQSSFKDEEEWTRMAEEFGKTLGNAPVMILCLVHFDYHSLKLTHNLSATWCAAQNMMLQAHAEGLQTGDPFTCIAKSARPGGGRAWIQRGRVGYRPHPQRRLQRRCPRTNNKG